MFGVCTCQRNLTPLFFQHWLIYDNTTLSPQSSYRVYFSSSNLFFLPRFLIYRSMRPSIFYIVDTPSLGVYVDGVGISPFSGSMYPSGLNRIITMWRWFKSCEISIIRLFSQVRSYVSCLFSSTSTIATWLPMSKNRSGRLLEPPPSILLSYIYPDDIRKLIFYVRCHGDLLRLVVADDRLIREQMDKAT